MLWEDTSSLACPWDAGTLKQTIHMSIQESFLYTTQCFTTYYKEKLKILSIKWLFSSSEFRLFHEPFKSIFSEVQIDFK